MRGWSILCVLLLLPMAHAGSVHDHARADALIEDWLQTRQVSTPESAEASVVQAAYPLPADPVQRFAEFEVREDLTTAGSLEGAVRVLRFAHVTDMQLVDDDAPAPIRTAPLDEVFAATISGGAERPQEEYGDEILHAMVDVLNVHHAMDDFDFAIHTGDNIDNALENELMRYVDILEGTHTTTGPLSGFACQPDGQSESVDDDANNVEDTCTSLPDHVAEAVRGAAPSFPWYSLNGNHDTLIQGNVPPQEGMNDLAADFGRRFIYSDEYVKMHFADLDPCAGGSSLDDFGHGYGFAGDRLCDDDVDNDAYYAWDFRGIRMIALDTVNDEVYETNANLGGLPSQEGTTGAGGASGASEGAIDVDQFNWLQEELEGAKGTLNLLFGHHTINAFYNRQFAAACGPPGCFSDILDAAGFIGEADMRELLAQYPNMPAFFGGHTHEHRVTPQQTFWNVETSGLLDMPQETRIVELWVTADGAKGAIALDPIGHHFQLAKDLGVTDPDHNSDTAAGTDLDRRTLLWFDMPAGVALEVGPQPPTETVVRFMAVHLLSEDEPEGTSTVEVQITDAATGAVLDGLDVSFAVHEIVHDGETMALDYAQLPRMNGTGNGTYSIEWTFEHGENRAIVVATDATGVYEPVTQDLVFHVEGHSKKSPVPLWLAPIGLLVAIAVRRSKQA